jgi:hypothetical protein
MVQVEYNYDEFLKDYAFDSRGEGYGFGFGCGDIAGYEEGTGLGARGGQGDWAERYWFGEERRP